MFKEILMNVRVLATCIAFIAAVSFGYVDNAFAGGHDSECCEVKPKVKYKTKWRTKTVYKTQKVPVKVRVPVKVPVPVKKDEPCCDRGSVTQTVNVNTQPPVKERIVERVRIKRKRVIKEVDVTKPNRVQLLLGASKTDQVVTRDDCCVTSVDEEHEIDVGLQYLRDFGHFTGSIGGTMNKSVYLGLGINW
jgi:hypothetical protein